MEAGVVASGVAGMQATGGVGEQTRYFTARLYVFVPGLPCALFCQEPTSRQLLHTIAVLCFHRPRAGLWIGAHPRSD